MMTQTRRLGLAIITAASLICIVDLGAAQQPSFASRSVSSVGNTITAAIREASQRFGVSEAWVRAVMWVESAGEVDVTSSAGATGLMQIMPRTYATLRAKLGLGANAYDPHDNIIAGAAYLREMHDRYGDGGFLAAYNAGPGRYEEFRAGGRPLPSETISYIARLGPMLAVASDPVQLAEVPGSIIRPENAPIFVQLGDSLSVSGSGQNSSQEIRLAALILPRREQADSMFNTHPAAVDKHVALEPSAQSLVTLSQNNRNARPGPVRKEDQSDGIFVHRSRIGTAR